MTEVWSFISVLTVTINLQNHETPSEQLEPESSGQEMVRWVKTAGQVEDVLYLFFSPKAGPN